ncbi:hypothetical protein Tco_0117429 [Tanacetum coccineum]
MSTQKFAETYNLVAVLEKPEENSQAKEIASLKERSSIGNEMKVKELRAKKVKKVVLYRVKSATDASLGAQRMHPTGRKHGIEFEKVVEEPVVSVAIITKSIPVSAAKVVTTASASVEILDELTLAQTLIEIKTAKPKPVTTAATTVTSIRPRAKGIIFHDQE